MDFIYYLLVILSENRTNMSLYIRLSYRCPHVNERLNSTLSKSPWLKRE